MEQEVDQLLLKLSRRWPDMRNALLEAGRCGEAERLSKLTFLQVQVEHAEKELNQIWDRLDEIINGDPEDDEVISNPYSNKE